jgi:anti-anti-sigma regulatory factor
MNAEAKGTNGKGPKAGSSVGPGQGQAKGSPVSPVSSTLTTIQIRGSLERGLDHVDRALASGVDLQLDFSECTFVTVDGLEWLEELLLRAQSLQSQVRIVKMHPTVYKVFKVAHISSLLKACDSPAPRGPVC